MSPKRVRFINEYLSNGCNATQAAIKAGFSEKTAKSQGQRLLTFVDVQEKIAEIQEDERKKAEVSREEVLSVLASIIRADIPDFVNADGKLKSLETLSGKHKKAIESIKIGRKGVLTLKLSSKLQAATLINRMMGYDKPEEINLHLDESPENYEKLEERLFSLVEKLKTGQ